uniref:Uncharacterized protein n=1 Tax=Ciona intestinalis TaxID=7719 RepID=H2XRM2_CIOIN
MLWDLQMNTTAAPSPSKPTVHFVHDF